MSTLLLLLALQQPVSTVGTNPAAQPALESPSALSVYCEQHRCELVLHVSSSDHELEGECIYLYLRPDVGQVAMCSGPVEGVFITWLRAHRDQTIVLSVREQR